MEARKVPKFAPSVRYINGLTIYFKNKYDVEVRWKNNVVVVTRWDKPGGGTYNKSWLPFCRKLCQNNHLEDIWQVMTLANQYELPMYSPRRPVNPIPQNTLQRPSIFKEKRNGRNI